MKHEEDSIYLRISVIARRACLNGKYTVIETRGWERRLQTCHAEWAPPESMCRDDGEFRKNPWHLEVTQKEYHPELGRYYKQKFLPISAIPALGVARRSGCGTQRGEAVVVHSAA